MRRSLLLFIGVGLLALGCQPQRRAEPRDRDDTLTAPATSLAEQLASFDGPGITIFHPADWTTTPSDDRVLVLMVPGTSARVSLDIPKLPPHVPGLIPLGLVVNGYADDLKKQYAGIDVGEPASAKVAGANGRRVRSQWEANGATRVENAVLTVHGDRVYILRANSDLSDEQAARAALDQVLASVKWD